MKSPCFCCKQVRILQSMTCCLGHALLAAPMLSSPIPTKTCFKVGYCLKTRFSRRKPGSWKVRRNPVFHDGFLRVFTGFVRVFYGLQAGGEFENPVSSATTRFFARNGEKPGSLSITCFETGSGSPRQWTGNSLKIAVLNTPHQCFPKSSQARQRADINAPETPVARLTWSTKNTYHHNMFVNPLPYRLGSIRAQKRKTTSVPENAEHLQRYGIEC